LPGCPPDPFLLRLAILNLLAEAAAERPLFCLVDDAQWLDRASLRVLGFVARRLDAESVGLVFAVREPDDDRLLDGLDELVVEGLPERAARALLSTVLPGMLDTNVRNRILLEARGNPLALLELPRAVTDADAGGGFPRSVSRTSAGRIEESFLLRIQSLPQETQWLLALAAAEPLGDLYLLRRAAGRLGMDLHEAAAPALSQKLVEFDSRVRFPHPLVRSAAYRNASQDRRAEAHRVLADVTDPALDADRRAWHRALATAVPDENVAGELLHCADRARARGGLTAAAAFLERATELTPDLATRRARALDAAEAQFEAADIDAAYRLALTAETGATDGKHRARLALLHARLVFARHRSGEAAELFLEAARRLQPLDPERAREACVEALAAAIFAGRLQGGVSVRDVAEFARALPRSTGAPSSKELLLEAVSTRLTAGYAPALKPLLDAMRALRDDAEHGHGDLARWLWLACPMTPEPVAPQVWADETWYDLADSAVRLARQTGDLASLPVALTYRGAVHLQAGEFAAASALIEEAEALSTATGNAPVDYASLLLTAWRDDEKQATQAMDRAIRLASAEGEGRMLGLAHYAAAVLHNGLSQFDLALDHARKAAEFDDFGYCGWYLVETVEAAARSGQMGAAQAALDQLSKVAETSGTHWVRGVWARSRALVSESEAAEELYREAIDRFGRTRLRLDLARAHLMYGEWLRRENRRGDARDHLRTAYRMYTGFGAGAFAGRAARELGATGGRPETATESKTTAAVALTAQEAQIAAMAGEGLTNPQISAQLFISPHTVEWHLRKVFTKLGIASRRELHTVLPGRLRLPRPDSP
jgi:DNA-binding CsgD family transcriptional regulator